MIPRFTRTRWVMIVSFLLLTRLNDQSLFAQQPANRIHNFRAASVSRAEVRVTVDYVYSGTSGSTDVFIHATPEDSAGTFDPRTVDFDEQPLLSGSHTATLTIRKHPGSSDFTSTNIRVCMSTLQKAILCEDFPHTHVWSVAETEPPQVAPPPAPAAGTCTIWGRLSGDLSYPVTDDRGNRYTETLRDIYLRVPGVTKAVRVRIRNNAYTFANVPAGVSYTIVPEAFRAAPRQHIVSCRPGKRHPANFRIIGPPRID